MYTAWIIVALDGCASSFIGGNVVVLTFRQNAYTHRHN